ncbi:MAG: hypothetical protein ABIU95_11855 [Burkholderiales bacterium]
MPTIYVLDVPEFRAIVDHAKVTAGFKVTGPTRGYYRVSATPTIRLERKVLGFKPAVWHGSLTGGLIGRIEQFDNDVLVIGDETSA